MNDHCCRNKCLLHTPFVLYVIIKIKEYYVTSLTDAAITDWSAPAILATPSGNIEIGTAVDEGSKAVGSELFTATATSGDTVTYTLVSSTDSVGTIVASTGVVNVATGKSLDYETASKYVFVVR